MDIFIASVNTLKKETTAKTHTNLFSQTAVQVQFQYIQQLNRVTFY